VTQFVLDASIVLTWCFPDEEAQKAEKISERIALGDKLTVPAFWWHEVLNALLGWRKAKARIH
jgi:predicted nucleic acid-binding protein